jgi:hypothetical protein
MQEKFLKALRGLAPKDACELEGKCPQLGRIGEKMNLFYLCIDLLIYSFIAVLKGLNQGHHLSYAPSPFVCILLYFIYLFIYCSSGVSTQGLHLEPPHQPFFVKNFFQDRVS